MSNHRVQSYECVLIYVGTNATQTTLCKFTQDHAIEAGVSLEDDGIPVNAAKSLCEKWTRAGRRNDIHYTFRIPHWDALGPNPMPAQMQESLCTQ